MKQRLSLSKKKIRLAAILTLIISIAPGCGTAVRNTPLRGTVDLQGHRGARGARPENSIPAFIYCMEKEMDTIELDTNLTSDGNLIVYHDSELNPKLCLTPEGKPASPLPIKDLTEKELKQYDCGAVQNSKFPRQKAIAGTTMITLDEFFAFIKDYEKKHPGASRPGFNIELKFPDVYDSSYFQKATAAMILAVKKSNMASRITVQSFIPEALPIIKKTNPGITTSALFLPNYWKGFKMILGLNADRKKILAKTIDVKADYISPYYLYVTPAFVKKCHDKNIRVITWTVNSKKKMIQMLNAGVDGIISDYPELLKKTYLEWKNKEKKGNK